MSEVVLEKEDLEMLLEELREQNFRTRKPRRWTRRSSW